MAATELVTSLPLIFFAAAANHLSLTVVGLLNYLTPSISFVVAILVYHEPFGIGRMITFSFVWAGIALFTPEAMQRKNRSSAIVQV